jgi:hypothetical protein
MCGPPIPLFVATLKELSSRQNPQSLSFDQIVEHVKEPKS